MHKTNRETCGYGTSAANTPTQLGTECFKLSDSEMNYMTSKSNNPDVIGVMIVPK
jgi:hypothetical protein